MAKALKKVALVVGAVALVATGVGAVVGGAAFAAATGGSLATVTAIGTVASIASTALNMISPPKPRSTVAGQQTSFKLDPQSGIDYPVGRTFVGGRAVHRETWGADNQYQGFAIAWGGGGPIDGIERFYYDKTPINFDGAGNATGSYKDFMWLRSQLGACPSPALASPVAGFPGWTGTSKLSGYAASIWVVKFDKKGKKYATGLGAPGIVGRMVKVYDPRLDSTYPGGSGPCRAGQEDTYVYSECPWLHALTWALGRWQNGKKVIGIGMLISQIAVASFVDAANVAELNNWKCGGVVSSIDDKNEVLKMFAQAGGGQCVKLGAKLTAFVEAPRVSIATINESDLVAEATIAGTQFERNRINGVVPIIRSEAHGWEQVPCDPVRFDVHVAEDGGRRTAETELVLVQQIKQGAELVAYEVLNAREFGPIDLQLKLQWLGIEPGDLVTLNIPSAGLNNQPALALVRGLDWETGNVALSLRSEDPTKHGLALGRTTTVAPSPSLTPPDTSIVAAPAVDAWAVTAEIISAPDGTGVPIIVARGATGNPNASNTVFEYRPVVAPVGPMPPAPTIGQIATDATGAEFVYETGGWARRWIMQATQDAGVTVQEFSAVTPLTSYQVAVSYVVRGVLGERLVLGPITSGPLLGRGRLFVRFTAPTAEESNGGDTWQDSNGRYWTRRDDIRLGIGTTPIGIGADDLTIVWTPVTIQPVRDGIDAALATAIAATDAAKQLALDAQATADGKVAFYKQDATPTAEGVRDQWFKTDTRKWYVAAVAGANSIGPGQWELTEDSGIGAALLAASDAQATADGKIATFISETPPVAEGNGDFWYKESTAELRRWDEAGATWGDPIVDLTAATVPRQEGPSTDSFTADYQGTLDAEQWPRSYIFKRYRGPTDVSAASPWTIVSQTGISGGTVTVVDGVVTIPTGVTLAGTSTIVVKSTRPGDPDMVSELKITRVDALPPSSGGGGSGTSVSDSSFVSFETTTFVDVSDVLTVKTGSGGNIALSAPLQFRPLAAAPAGDFYVALLWRYRAVGGSWTDVAPGAETASSPAEVQYEPPYLAYSGFVSCARSLSGLTASADYEVKLMARQTSGTTRTFYLSGKASAVGS